MINFIFKFIIYIFVFILIYIIIGSVLTLIINRIKGTTKQFQIFKKKVNIDLNEEYMMTIFKKIQGYKKIIKYHNMYILLHEKEILIIKSIEYDNKIKGNIDDEYLINKISFSDEKTIPNFFQELTDLTNKIQEKLNQPVKKIILKKEICLLEMDIPIEYTIVSKTNCLYTLNKMLKDNRKVYTKIEIKQFVRRLYGINKNKVY